MRLRNWPAALGVAAAVGLLAGTISAADYVKPSAEWDAAPCRRNPEMDLAAYAVVYSSLPPISLGGGRTVPNHSIPNIPAAGLVPKAFMIYNSSAKFIPAHSPGKFIVGAVHSLRLPIPDYKQWMYGNMVKHGDVIVSPCRVRDPSGKWWLVRRDGYLNDVELNYYELDEFEPFVK